MLWNHCCSAVNIFEQEPLDDSFSSFQEDSLSNLRTTLPRNIPVDGRMYVLVGYTLYKEGASHFTAAVMWRNKWWFYDGLSETDQTRIHL